MIVDQAESVLLSNLGWVDRGSIRTFDIASGRVSNVPLGEGDFVRLLPGQADLFAAQLVSHKRPGAWLSVTVRRAGAPAEVLARWTWGQDRAEGDELTWNLVPHAFVGYDPQTQGYVTASIDPSDRGASAEPVTWFDEDYDWGYQQPMTVTAVPESGLLLYSVQRSSELVLYDPARRRVERKIELAGSAGNPEPFFRQTAPELWVADYDHLLRLDTRNWQILEGHRLQDAGEGSRLFIGDFAFDMAEQRCAIARPFSADAVVLDGRTFEQIGRVGLDRQPLDVALLADGRVFARDWGTGNLLAGQL